MIRFSRALIALFLLLSGEQIRAADEPTPLNTPVEKKCLAVLREGLNSTEFWPAMHAAEALTLAGYHQEVLAALAKRKEDDDQKRCGLAREAVRAGDRTQLPILFEILSKVGSNGHAHAAESLFKVAEIGDGVQLRAAFAQNTNLRVKLMAAAALARCGHPTALDACRARLTDPDRELRKVAVWILGQLGQNSDIPSIRAGLSSETDLLARAYIIHALAVLGDAEARKTLGKNLESPDFAVRTYAAEFTGYSRAAEHREKLIALLDDNTLDVRIRAAQSLIVLSKSESILGLPPARTAANFHRDVFPATAKNPRYSEGSVIALRDGTLLYATTEFIGKSADAATARIIGCESRDRGQTWNEPRVLQENVGKQNVMSVTLRRLKPHAVDGPLGMFYLVKNGPSDLKAYLRITRDEARTFEAPICVTDQPGYHVMNNDRVTILASGRLICPISWAADLTRAGHFVCLCFFSDDLGKTWKKSQDTVDAPKRGAMEPEVIEINKGRLMMIVRTQMGHIATAFSSDGGDHWGEPSQLNVKAPEAPATIRTIPATGDWLLVWNNTFTAGAGHGGKRTPLTAAISSDEGKTWRHLQDLETRTDQAFAYTSLHFYKDRLLMTYYVSDPNSDRLSSRFRSISVQGLYAKGD